MAVSIGALAAEAGVTNPQIEALPWVKFLGFRCVHSGGRITDEALKVGLKPTVAFANWGMPPKLRHPFVNHRGKKTLSASIFCHVNFNYEPFREWWRKFVPEVAERYKGKAVLAYKPFNEFHYGFLFDYSEPTLRRYRSWLKSRYGSIEALNEAWGTNYRDFSEVEPPREVPTEEVANWIEWREFTTWTFSDFFAETRRLIKSVDEDALVGSNFWPFPDPVSTGWNPWELARSQDFLAYDIYAVGRWEWMGLALDEVRSAARCAGREAWLLEFMGGPNNWRPKVTADDIWLEAHLALSRDIRCIIFYMWRPAPKGREQGIHGLTDSKGGPTERLTASSEFARECLRLSTLGDLRGEPKVAVLNSTRSNFLLMALGRDRWRPRGRMLDWARALGGAGFSSDFIEHENLLDGTLERYRVLVIPSVPSLSAREASAVRAFVERGGTLLCEVPSGEFDELGRKHQRPPLSELIGAPKWIPVRSDPFFPSTLGLLLPALRPKRGALAARSLPPGAEPLLLSEEGAVAYARKVGRGWAVALGGEVVGADSRADIPPAQFEFLRATLERTAGLRPEAEAYPEDPMLDIRVRKGERAWAVHLTALDGKAGRGPLALVLRAPMPSFALLVRPPTRALRRLDFEHKGGLLYIYIPKLDVANEVVLLYRGLLPAIELPEHVAKGGRVRGRAVVYCAGEPPSREAFVKVRVEGLSKEWGGVRAEGGGRLKIGPNTVASVEFTIRASPEAKVDRSRTRRKVVVELVCGGIKVETEQGLGVVEPLDAFVFYGEECLNPWQEISPPLLRWGFGPGGEVRIKPPSIPAWRDVKLTLSIEDRTGVKGPVDVEILAPEGLGLPRRLEVEGGMAKVPVRASPGDYKITLRLKKGKVRREVNFTLRARVEPESLNGFVKGMKPKAGAVGGVLACDREGREGLCVVEVKAPEGTIVADRKGKAVPQEGAADGRIRFVARLEEGKPVAFWFLPRPEGFSAPRAFSLEGRGRKVIVKGPVYEAAFDLLTGRLERLSAFGEALVEGLEFYIVGKQGREVAYQGDFPGTVLAKVGATEATVEARSEMVAGGERFSLQVRHTLLPDRLKVEGEVRTAKEEPARPVEVGLSYAVGRRLGGWRLFVQGLRPTEGFLPKGFSLGNEDYWAIFFEEERGLGVAELPLYSHALRSWWSGFLEVSHAPGKTRHVISRGYVLNPTDALRAGLELVPLERLPVRKPEPLRPILAGLGLPR